MKTFEKINEKKFKNNFQSKKIVSGGDTYYVDDNGFADLRPDIGLKLGRIAQIMAKLGLDK